MADVQSFRCRVLEQTHLWSHTKQTEQRFHTSKVTKLSQCHKTVPKSQLFQRQKTVQNCSNVTKLFQRHTTVPTSQNCSVYILPVITNTIAYAMFDPRFDSIIAGTNKRFLEILVDNPDACFAHYCIEYDRVWMFTHQRSDISRSSPGVHHKP